MAPCYGWRSPHTRGARVQHQPVKAQPRIIPAYAGSTDRPLGRPRPGADHPRIRGEHGQGVEIQRQEGGSSPRVCIGILMRSSTWRSIFICRGGTFPGEETGMVVREAAWGRIGVHAEKFSEQGHEQGHMGRVPWVGLAVVDAVGDVGALRSGRLRGGLGRGAWKCSRQGAVLSGERLGSRAASPARCGGSGQDGKRCGVFARCGSRGLPERDRGDGDEAAGDGWQAPSVNGQSACLVAGGRHPQRNCGEPPGRPVRFGIVSRGSALPLKTFEGLNRFG
jgi:hypothetical protein